MRRVKGHLVKTDGTMVVPSRESITQALSENEVVWLDLADSGTDTIDVLRDVFKFHPLAVENARNFRQRPKAEDFDDFTYIVAYGAPIANADGDTDASPAEVHCFYSEHYLVTVHHGPLPAIETACEVVCRHHGAPHVTGAPMPLVSLYHVLDALADSMFPYLAAFDDRIDALQDQIFVKPTNDQLAEMFQLKRELVVLRRLVTPQRDTMSSLLAGTVELPGMTAEKERYFRDLYDHLIRISDLVDSYRDLLSGSMDAYLSTVSNRLNVVMKQLTIIATVFLPLSFLTGFFGQNFGWMVQRLGSLYVFLILGLGTELLAASALFWLFWQRGWLGDKALCQA
jgi:magnesium transporter